ncbi:MAG: YigZ family protein [Burkholderiaceae bacterium]
MSSTLEAACHAQLTIRKSRFIGCVRPARDRDQALAALAELRAQHPQATHVCWALMAGAQSAAHDDGEPSGTAGRPMLDVLRLQSLDQVMASVVRYFGGIRLGAGGLTRAYSGTIAQALQSARLVPIRAMSALAVAVPYAYEGTLRHWLAQSGIVPTDVAHGSLVRFELQVATDEADALRAAIDQMCQGRTAWS